MKDDIARMKMELNYPSTSFASKMPRVSAASRKEHGVLFEEEAKTTTLMVRDPKDVYDRTAVEVQSLTVVHDM